MWYPLPLLYARITLLIYAINWHSTTRSYSKYVTYFFKLLIFRSAWTYLKYYNVRDKRAQQISERNTFHALYYLYIQPQFIPQANMLSSSNKARLILAVGALEQDENLSLWAVAKIYSVDHMTLFHQRAGWPSRGHIPANSRKLTDLEEQTIVQYIIELYTRIFHPKLQYVEDMANWLLYERDAPPVSIY